ncbi:hypothetical protein AB0N06_37685 [Streptomyces sp. NPDC051020]|uniref:hypothetical protein n=1 Tax=Streptomyces sp. NPDC051020 TaxID=3155409 RepID=UPI00344AAB64
MRATSFLASVTVTETVAGLGLGASRGQIRETLGDQCLADQRKKSLRLDYGILEFNLFAGRCETIAVQVRRLANGIEGLIPPVLSTYFQGISKGIPFEALRNEIERDDACLLEELQGQPGYRRYRFVKSHVNLYVVDEVAPEGESFALGDLWSIMISGRG